MDLVKHEHYVLVVGAGGSGLRASMGLSQSDLSVACISKVFPTRSHTNAALCSNSMASCRKYFLNTSN